MRYLDVYNTLLKENISSYEELPFPVHKKTFKKKTILTRYGQVESNTYFINAGIIELKIKSYTSEKILDFFFAHEMVACFTSFLLQQPSDAEMTTLTDCELEVISYHDLQNAYKTSLQTNQLGRMLTEHAYLRKAQREKDLL